MNNSNASAKRAKKSTPGKYLLVSENSSFALREAYKSVRTNLLSIMSVYENEPKHVCITSPETSDGKTLTCANIAITFAQMGAKVLVIDADMRKPKLHRAFKVSAFPGLADCLGGFCSINEAIVPYKDAEGVYLFPSGKIPPNPTELILSTRFNDLLKSLENEFDYVFIDAPPAGIVTDAIIISKKTLGAIIVCRAGKTKSDVAKKAMNEIVSGGGRVLGALLNGVNYGKFAKNSGYRHGDNYGYYNSADEEF